MSTAVVGSALVVGLQLIQPDRLPRSVEIHNWIVIAPDGTVTIRIPQVEMGQGGVTSLAQLLAEELEVNWSHVRTEFISIAKHLAQNRVYGRTETAASSGVRKAERQLRTVGAQIRTMLVKVAARRMGASESGAYGGE